MGKLYSSKHGTTTAVAFVLVSSIAMFWKTSPPQAAIESVTPGKDLGPSRASSSTPVDSKPETVERADELYGKLPMSFEANAGQMDPRVKFIARGSASTLFLTSKGAVLTFRTPAKKGTATVNGQLPARRVAAMRMRMMGANPATQVVGRDRLLGSTNYFRGKDPSKWQSNVPTYAKIVYQDLYPGVDLVYYGNQQTLEYDFELAPGADPRSIKIAFEGIRKVRVDANGDLVLRKAGCEIRMRKPAVYQELDGTKQSVSGRYALRGNHQVGFQIGKYDKSKPLVIDPVLTYSTYLGGSGDDSCRSIAIDSAGNAYVTGQTTSFNFPVTINSYNTTYANGYDVFVTKLNADGTAMLYSTYVGGDSGDIGYGIAVDSAGNAYVTGATSSINYPTTPGAFQTVIGNTYNGHAFVTKLNSDGTALVYSTYLTGSSSEQANAIAVDSSGNAYVTGYTNSSNFPTTPGAFRTFQSANSQDAFVTKLNNTATGLLYSTFLGGSGADQGTAIKVDSSGYAYVTGMTTSVNFDVTLGAYQIAYGGSGSSYYGYGDAFVTKLNTSGTGLIYSTYLGGRGDDAGFGIDLASSGEVFLTGSTNSVNFPTTAGVVRVGDGGMAKSTNGGDSWAAINSGLTSPTEVCLAIDPSNPNVVFVGSSDGGVFKSINGGASWTASNSGLTDLRVKALAIDPMITSKMYLGTNSRGIFRSTDGGATWKAIDTFQNGSSVNAIKIDPTNSSTIYIGTDAGVFKTTNGGAVWAAANTGLNQANVNALAIDPGATSTLYAGIGYYSGGVFKSTDGGTHWNATGLGSATVSVLALDPTATFTIYAATSNGVFKTIDGGTNWSGVNSGITNRTVNALAISPVMSSTLYAGTGNGLFKTTNGGSSWNPENNGLAGAVINALAIDPITTQTLYCGSAAGSTDAFVTKLNATGTALVYSTYLGGSGGDQCNSVAVDASGNAYVTGTTGSQNFPTTHGSFQLFGGYGNDAFVTKLSATASALIYSTFLGGTDYDQGFGIAVDSSGSAYVTGNTQSQNFPTTAGAFQTVKSSYGYDGFIAKVAAVPSLAADLGVTMTAPAGSFTAGSIVTYNIKVTNNGPDQASVIQVNDDLPSSLGFYSCGSCTHAGNSVNFSISSLAVGASANLQVTAYVSCTISASATIDNTVTVDSSSTDPNSSNNSTMATISATNPGVTISPTSQSFPNNGGNGFVNISPAGNCVWSATSNANWITINNCCYSVYYSVTANTGPDRTGTMTIAGQTFTVNQAAGCAAIDHTSKNFTSVGGTDSVSVSTSDANCSWTATKTANWITITSGSSGTGNGTVNYSVAANTGIARSTTISIGQTLTVNQAAPAFQGVHDAAGCNTIQGWAWDANNPNATVSVDIYNGATFIGTVPANMYREDLLNALGSPYHGFSIYTPAALKNGAVYTINVKFSGTNIPLINTGRTIQCSLPPNLFGRHDGQGCNVIEGWAWDANDPNGTVNVDIYDGSTFIATVAATLYRQDLADAFGSPYHGWIFHTPASLRDGHPHTLTAKFGDTNQNLPLDTPRTTSCTSGSPNYQGNFDTADCNFISGYAWDTTDDQGTIVVAIYVDGAFFVVVPAQGAYPGVGSGYHGFKFAVPSSLKNNQQHSVQLRFSGTATSLSNSPKTITCPP